MRVARVHVIALVVDAVVGLTLGLIARVIIVVFVVAFRSHFSVFGGILFTNPSVTVNCCWLLPNCHCNSASN